VKIKTGENMSTFAGENKNITENMSTYIFLFLIVLVYRSLLTIMIA